jgi:triosephosphate isomerase
MDGGEKKYWIVANWKSNMTIAKALEWVSMVGPQLQTRDNVQVVVCPTMLALEHVKKAVVTGGFPIMVGAQNISPFTTGAYTGEVSAELLKEVTDVTLIGHSERRKSFGETDEMVEQKVKMARDVQITPIVCVQDESTAIPEGVKIVAYEPVWAIGSGTPDTPENANQVAAKIKEHHPDITILYGGSVKSENSNSFLEQEHIQGLLIGGASLEAEQFVTIIKQTYQLS